MINSTTIPVLEQVLNFAQARHGVLAGNIANIDTPGYRGVDLSPEQFEARLKQAIERRDAIFPALSPGDPRFSNPELEEVGDSMKTILYHDQSDVSLEHQVTEISKNQALHNLALTIMTSQFRLLQTAISERVT